MADAETLRARLARKPIVVAPGVYDHFTALVATQAGFATLYVSGAAIAYTRLGRPDIGLVSMTQVAETLTLIRDRVSAQLIVDAAVVAAVILVPAAGRKNGAVRVILQKVGDRSCPGDRVG